MGGGYDCVDDKTASFEGQKAGIWNKVSQKYQFQGFCRIWKVLEFT